MWLVYALLAALFASLTAIFAKLGIEGVDTDLATAIRTVVILFLAWGIAFYRGGVATINTVTTHNFLFLILSGIATGLSWIFYFKALKLGNVSQVAPIDKLSVALTILLAFLILKEPISPKILLGAGLIMAGTLVLTIK